MTRARRLGWLAGWASLVVVAVLVASLWSHRSQQAASPLASPESPPDHDPIEATRAQVVETEDLARAPVEPDASVGPLLMEFVKSLRGALADLESVLTEDLKSGADTPRPTPAFRQARRQHTPGELIRAAGAAGFSRPRFLGVHPHVLPPGLEAVAPRFYHRLGAALEPLESTPTSLYWSSAFLGVFTR